MEELGPVIKEVNAPWQFKDVRVVTSVIHVLTRQPVVPPPLYVEGRQVSTGPVGWADGEQEHRHLITEADIGPTGGL